MYVVKNKDGLLMKVLVFPATPPCVAMFHENVVLELAEKFETKEEALATILDLIVYHDEHFSKFDGYSVEKIS